MQIWGPLKLIQRINLPSLFQILNPRRQRGGLVTRRPNGLQLIKVAVCILTYKHWQKPYYFTAGQKSSAVYRRSFRYGASRLLVREFPILGFSCELWEPYSFILVCGRHRQCPGTKQPHGEKNSAHNHKSYQREVRRGTHREGASSGYILKASYKSSHAVGPISLTGQHGFTTCVHHTINACTANSQDSRFQRCSGEHLYLCMSAGSISSSRGDKQSRHMSQYLVSQRGTIQRSNPSDMLRQ